MNRPDSIDEAFKRRVKAEFNRALGEAKKQGFSVEDFARKLGITRAGAYKILAGATIPSLRVLRYARKYWGVSVNYGELGDGYIKAKRTDPRQMEFQLSLGDISKEQIAVAKFSPRGENSLELLIKIDFSRTA